MPSILANGWKCKQVVVSCRCPTTALSLYPFRYTFDNIGAVFFGEAFGFLENSHDHGNYIHAVHLAMPFLSIVTMAPSYLRPFLLIGATTIPKLLKAVLAVDGIRVTAVEETAKGKARSEDATSKRHDILSQLLAIVQEKGDKVNFTHNEVTSEMWTGVYVYHEALYKYKYIYVPCS